MKITTLGCAALLAALSACGSAEPDTTTAGAPAAARPTIYEASGTVTAVEPGRVTIDHGPVPGLHWPAMTMAFAVPAPVATEQIAPGVPVRFSFEEAGGDYRLVSIEPRATP